MPGEWEQREALRGSYVFQPLLCLIELPYLWRVWYSFKQRGYRNETYEFMLLRPSMHGFSRPHFSKSHLQIAAYRLIIFLNSLHDLFSRLIVYLLHLLELGSQSSFSGSTLETKRVWEGVFSFISFSLPWEDTLLAYILFGLVL